MNAKQFFDAVVKLRELQGRYFKERSTIALQTAKKQERIIDDEIKRVNQIQEQRKKQLNIFEL